MTSEPRRLSLLPKLMELQQALFFNLSDAVLKISTSVVTALHIDDINQVWFMVHRPSQQLSEFERDFLSRLEFYKKGASFHMHVHGRACLVIDPEELNQIALHLPKEIMLQVNSNMVLVKMKIEHVEYFPHREKQVRVIKLPVQQFQPSAFIKTLQYIFKDIIPVFQSH